MMLITKEIESKLRKNESLPEELRMPHLKLFNPVGSGTWLVSEIESGSVEDGTAILFGLAHIHEPEMGSFSLAELTSMRLPLGLSIERDRSWRPTKTLVEYAEDARSQGYIQ